MSKKKVSIKAQRPISFESGVVFRGDYTGEVDIKTIRRCIMQKAIVEEIFSNGTKLTLDLSNYNTENDPKVIAAKKAEEEAAKKKAAEEAAAKAKAEAEAKANAEAEAKAKAEKEAEEKRIAEEAAKKVAEEEAARKQKAAEAKAQIDANKKK